MIELKIEDHTDQQFEAVLNGRRVTLRLWYNQTSERWELDLAVDDLPVLNGRRIVVGVDILKPFDFGIGVLFAADVVAGSVPDRVSLPNGTVKLFQTTEAEIKATNGDPFFEPVTPTVRPILWTPPPAEYFGYAFGIGRLLDQIEEGFAIDFAGDEVLIRSNANPSLNFIGTWQSAIDNAKFEFARPSVAYRYNDAGLIVSDAIDVLRVQRDPLTGLPVGAILEPASSNLVPSSAVATTGTNVNVTANAVTAPDGTMTAELVTENAVNGEHYAGDMSITGTTVGQKYLWSAFVKKTDNPRPFYLRTATAKSASAYFNPATGAWLGGSGYLSRGFETLPNDWFRVWMIVEIQTAGNLVCRAQLANWALTSIYTGDNVSGLYVWGRDARLLDRVVQHFPTSGVAAGPSADDFKIPLASIPWFAGVGEFLVNDVVVAAPPVVADKLEFPTTYVEPIRTLRYRII